MGWNSWNKFGCNITEDLIKETTELIIQLGLHQVGYTYVNLDDCWMMEERDQNGHLVVDPIAFPSGMKALGDFIHSKGLLFGLYQSAGIMTCALRAGHRQLY